MAVDRLNILNLDLTNTNIIGSNTDRVPEDADPINLYYTDGRFDARLATKSTSDIKEGKILYYTEQRVRDNDEVKASTQHRSNTYNLHPTSLYNLIDTNISAPVVGQYLTYNYVDGKWRNTTIGSIDTLSDVVITAPIATNSYLTYNSINWVNKTFPINVDEFGNISMGGNLNVDTWITEHEANNDKVSADGSINTHSDVLITGTPSDNQLLIYSTGQWRNTNSPFLRLDGTASMTGGLNMGGQSITGVNLVDGVDVSVLDSSVVKTTGDQTIGGTKTFSHVINASAGIDMKSQSITNGNLVDGIDVSGLDTSMAKLTGDQTIAGAKTFSNAITATLGIASNDKMTIAQDKPLIMGRTTRGLAAYTGGLELYGTSGVAGPHIQAFTTLDPSYPCFQLINNGDSNITLKFDCYWDGAANDKSSSSTSNFMITKGTNLLFQYASGIAVGSNITFNTAMDINSTSGLLTTKAITASGAITANAGVSTTTLTTRQHSSRCWKKCFH